ncbi:MULTISPECIES: signal recognition particle-docking protein FtsY [unclassified Thalassolituus]|uniref:signal recognition particle-docking protein FtsY n=1 Tax=Oceanospirillaceae TaxID=135620 RepID=UPI001195198D|nr:MULTISPECIES: signal recognition particle-docking protein FtsY [unclassified Thalassolituus]MCA6058862.1 signal recognition particle-docking protein FtsY [Thalassolituus sp. ST750PaO-4]TVV44775.1 signal recognition particle-docking protein FtsY [Thalassolituus sp. C2-1]
MFDFFKRKKNAPEAAKETPAESESPEQSAEPSPEQVQADSTEAVTEAAAAPAAEVVTPVAAASPVTEDEAVADDEPVEAPVAEVPAPAQPQTQDKPLDNQGTKKPGFFSRIRQGLSKTRSGLSDGLANLLLGKKEIDDDLLEELETQLIMADVGVEATQDIMSRLTARVSRKELSDSDALYNALIGELQDTLGDVQAPLVIDSSKKPYVILMVGINGVGKTTTIGKLAKQFQSDGKNVMLAAGDTFRAAAVEQLQVWGERNNVPVIAQHTGADSASVLYDALEAAKARKVDVLIADTAGRLHTKDNLMQELEKVVRVMKKLDDSAPHEVMLVLDAGTGQNAINQARQFQQAVGVTGLTLTKLDGTAKGGIIFALARHFGLPVRYIGVGEGIDDLRPFNAEEFTRALFQREQNDNG